MSGPEPDRYQTEIARALTTPGGHLNIGRSGSHSGGYSLHFENARLNGYDCEMIKAAAITAGLPVFHEMPPAQVADLLDAWLQHVRANGE